MNNECLHEELLQDHTLQLKGLEGRADAKDRRLDEMDKKIDKIDKKIDHLTEAITELQMQSLQDDNNIDKRVTALENTVQVLKWITTLLFGSGVIWILFNLIK